MRFGLIACSIAAVACVSTNASAQKGGGGGSVHGGGANGPSGKIVVVRDPGSLEGAARARAAAGDCKRALDLFDAALETSISPELHRDRGICHEKLGNPYPAIDDYRFYLTMRPDAPDAERIRDRLDELLANTGQTPADKSGDKPDAKKDDKKKDDKADISASAGTTGAGDEVHSDASATVSMGNSDADGGKSVDALDADEKLSSEADASSLRKGKGFVIGPYFAERNWTKGGFGWGEAIGAAFRYSLGAPSSLITEVGYSTINSSGTDSALGGIMLFGGYEARLGLDPRYTNAIIFQGGLGYERLTQGGTGLIASIVLPRVRGGFRHIFGPNIGLEVGVDAGIGFVHVVDTSADDSTLMIGGAVALLVGF